MEDKTQFDVSIFIAESLSINKKVYKKIDEIYNKNLDINREKSKSNIFYYSHIAEELSLTQTYYFRKILSILDSTDYIFELLELGYKYSYNYIKSVSKLYVSKLVAKLVNKNISDDELNGHILASIVLANSLDKEIDLEDEFYNTYISSLSQRFFREINNINVANLDGLSKEDKLLLRKVELNLRKLYLKDTDPLTHKLKLNGIYIDTENLTTLDKRLGGFEYIYDLEKISIKSVIEDDNLSSQDIQELIYCWSTVNKFNNLEKINYQDLYTFIVPAIQIRYLLRAYKKSKNIFFDNLNESLKLQGEINSKKIEEINKNNIKLEKENDSLKKEIELLKSKNNSLKNELNSLATSKLELTELRNYIFNQQKNEDFTENKEDVNLNEFKCVVFGGHPKWIERMKNTLNSWTFIPVESINFDVSIIDNTDYIFINTDYLSHAFYYKIINNINNKNKLKYISGSNIDLTIQQIKKMI